jgi:hypothetical protein
MPAVGITDGPATVQHAFLLLLFYYNNYDYDYDNDK